jgi:5-methylcytosine-specific restriction enzyme A
VHHFVAYQNSDKEGRFNDGRSIRVGGSGRWFTAKRFRKETIVGHRLWAIEGGGSPKRYRLVSSGRVTRITPRKRPQPYRGMGLDVHFGVDAPLKQVDVSDLAWFKKLRKEQRSFSYGLNKIKSRRVIAGLTALLGKDQTAIDNQMGSAARPNRGLIAGHEHSTMSVVRRSPAAAGEIVRRLIPEKHLAKVLKAVAHSVRVAHQQAPTKWGLRLSRDSVMLKVGFVEVLQLGKGWFHLLLESSSLSEQLRADHARFGGVQQYRNAPGCETCDIDDPSMIKSIYAALLPAHERAIAIAALSPRHTSTTKDHSPGLLSSISRTLKIALPSPDYAEAVEDSSWITTGRFEDEELLEGAGVQALVNRYERDPTARMRCIQHYGTTCVVCDTSLAERYGSEVDGLIHVHHLSPLAEVGAESSVDPVRDLRPVCPNCHAVIHSVQPARTIEQVRQMLLR